MWDIPWLSMSLTDTHTSSCWTILLLMILYSMCVLQEMNTSLLGQSTACKNWRASARSRVESSEFHLFNSGVCWKTSLGHHCIYSVCLLPPGRIGCVLLSGHSLEPMGTECGSADAECRSAGEMVKKRNKGTSVHHTSVKQKWRWKNMASFKLFIWCQFCLISIVTTLFQHHRHFIQPSKIYS